MEKVKFGDSEYDLMEIHNKEFYQVVSDSGEKFILISGYIWRYDREEWRLADYENAYIPILDNTPIEEEDVSNIEMDSKMYEFEGFDEEDAVSFCNFFDDEPIYPLPIEKVTLDTPDGCYINIEPK